jgi:hypothetical protein
MVKWTNKDNKVKIEKKMYNNNSLKLNTVDVALCEQ